jgi:hypothetical protein
MLSPDAHPLWTFLPPFLPPGPFLPKTNAIQCLHALADLLPHARAPAARIGLA